MMVDGDLVDENSDIDGGDLDMESVRKLSMMCWNVCGWSNLSRGETQSGRGVGENDVRSLVLKQYQPDIVGVVESWLRKDEEVVFEGYKWFGNNRKVIHKKAVRGSGGVGVLVKESLLRSWSCEVLDNEVEDILWVKLSSVVSELVLLLAVCYIPPISSVCNEERWLRLSEQVSKYACLGTVILCGDFNARCGNMDEAEGVACRVSEDQVINEQGRMMVDWTRSLGLCMVNGRVGSGDFTCVSPKGSSVVDYCLLFKDDLEVISDFEVVSMTDFVDRFHAGRVVERIPDHSALVWEVVIDNSAASNVRDDDTENSTGDKFRYVVPDGYLGGKEKEVRSVEEELHNFDGDQALMDSIYVQLVEVMFGGLQKIRCRSTYAARRNHRWFTKDLMALRKTFHQSEHVWLRAKDSEDRKNKRKKYIVSRRAYVNAVTGSKRRFLQSQRQALENLLGNPKKWWREVKKLGISSKNPPGGFGRVYDENGVARSGEKGRKVWSEHFKEVLQGGKESPTGCHALNGDSKAKGLGGSSKVLEDELTQEEVMWALGKVKKGKAVGKDGISVEMMSAECLTDVWVKLFNVCWKFGVVPSLWKHSIIVPVPKKRVHEGSM